MSNFVQSTEYDVYMYAMFECLYDCVLFVIKCFEI
jgi:hypothetical protein